eukprot:CAMPEP_0180534598 /NCGR_PEP_ID=MMETSP1036_2-20121128/64267_1 /TAXON_ID=632150 /ORGANISM="Azadinium spinosum, Strain 3D9" /LENGTH=48 /DNA_ID= /DNA_START= /DNA_END= /DNA_ORIENTATION=
MSLVGLAPIATSLRISSEAEPKLLMLETLENLLLAPSEDLPRAQRGGP